MKPRWDTNQAYKPKTLDNSFNYPQEKPKVTNNLAETHDVRPLPEVCLELDDFSPMGCLALKDKILCRKKGEDKFCLIEVSETQLFFLFFFFLVLLNVFFLVIRYPCVPKVNAQALAKATAAIGSTCPRSTMRGAEKWFYLGRCWLSGASWGASLEAFKMLKV